MCWLFHPLNKLFWKLSEIGSKNNLAEQNLDDSYPVRVYFCCNVLQIIQIIIKITHLHDLISYFQFSFEHFFNSCLYLIARFFNFSALFIFQAISFECEKFVAFYRFFEGSDCELNYITNIKSKCLISFIDDFYSDYEWPNASSLDSVTGKIRNVCFQFCALKKWRKTKMP